MNHVHLGEGGDENAVELPNINGSSESNAAFKRRKGKNSQLKETIQDISLLSTHQHSQLEKALAAENKGSEGETNYL